MTRAFLNRIGTAVPEHDIHADFVDFARTALPDARSLALFERMIVLSGIEHRYSFLEPGPKPRDVYLDRSRIYRRGAFPSTRSRMQLFEEFALVLAARAVERLGISGNRASITHLVVASCTGFSAPGLDLQLAARLGLSATVERTIIGFMGCFAAVNALKLARHIVRSEPDARVLVVNIELSTLHLQEEWELETMLMFLLFADGCTACLVSADADGLELDDFRASVIPRTESLITWHIGDSGFRMRLSGQVPGRIRRCLGEHGRAIMGLPDPDAIALWAVHAGGRSVLDAVQQGLGLAPDALRFSRDVLRDVGNVSSATLVFVLDRIMRAREIGGEGVAMAFGPGLSVETFRFRRAGSP